MSNVPSPTDQELAWLRDRPPVDMKGRRVPWSLTDRRIHEVNWPLRVEQEGLTLERVDFSATYWRGAVFRKCVLRDVSFHRTTLAHASFEDVVFERCVFDSSTLDACQMVRCRFEGCQMRFVTALQTHFFGCALTGLMMTVLDLRQCNLSDVVFQDSSLQGLRAGRLSSNMLQITGGELRGGDLTACRIRTLRLSGVALHALRVLDCGLEEATFSAGRVASFSLEGTEVGKLSLTDCPEILAPRVLSSRLNDLRIEACPSVVSCLIADSSIGRCVIQASTLYDYAFERVEAGEGNQIDGGALTGVFFNAGSWSGLSITGTRLSDYVTVTGTRFASLRFKQVQAAENLALRLQGDAYAEGSMTWKDAQGA